MVFSVWESWDCKFQFCRFWTISDLYKLHELLDVWDWTEFSCYSSSSAAGLTKHHSISILPPSLVPTCLSTSLFDGSNWWIAWLLNSIYRTICGIFVSTWIFFLRTYDSNRWAIGSGSLGAYHVPHWLLTFVRRFWFRSFVRPVSATVFLGSRKTDFAHCQRVQSSPSPPLCHCLSICVLQLLSTLSCNLFTHFVYLFIQSVYCFVYLFTHCLLFFICLLALFTHFVYLFTHSVYCFVYLFTCFVYSLCLFVYSLCLLFCLFIYLLCLLTLFIC